MRPDLAFIFSSGYGEFFHHVTQGGQPMPLVVGLHDCFGERSFKPEATVGRNLRTADWVTACSAAVLRTALHYLPALTAISSVIHNALPDPDGAIDTVAPTRFHLAFAGRLVRQKGVDILLAAMALLAGRFPSLRLSIAGEGDERPALEAEAARLGLAGRIDFVGRLAHDAIYPFLARADLVVVPSRIEPFGLVALEAAQVGRAVVASAVDGLPEVIAHGESGLLVAPEDPPALADAIAVLLDDPARARPLGAAARQRAAVLFAWDNYVGAHERLFETISGR
jgi:glycosyltransferase involved in cell wall biosynthesis